MTTEPIKQRLFGRLRDGRDVQIVTLTNSRGEAVEVSNYGCVIKSLTMPDRDGRRRSVVLGFPTLRAYEDDTSAVGAIIGRYANRIANGRFSIDETTVQLPLNQGQHHIHGGRQGFGKQLWSYKAHVQEQGVSIVLRRRSPAGEASYPGTLDIEVVYTLTNTSALIMEVMATTDNPTVINVTQHSYFNLSGTSNSVLDQQLVVDADEVLLTNADLIPTGQRRHVSGTPFDFRTAKRVGLQIDECDQQLVFGQGYDHCYVLRAGEGPAACLSDPVSGRALSVFTDQPGMQVYSGNWLGGAFAPRSGLCLETQHFPDSPNHDGFPSTVLRPGQVFRTCTRFQFSVVEA
ncbi:MAG: aldose epimerase family protein [Pseudomonadota bacterium]